MQQAIQRVSHVAIVVAHENARDYVQRLSKVLGITFDEPPIVNQAAGVLVFYAWDAGLEIVAPTREEGPYWERLQRYGEGSVTIVFGVADLDEGMRRAEANGAPVVRQAKLNGDEPWLQRFSSFREARLNIFDDKLACPFVLSEIVPAEAETAHAQPTA